MEVICVGFLWEDAGGNKKEDVGNSNDPNERKREKNIVRFLSNRFSISFLFITYCPKPDDGKKIKIKIKTKTNTLRAGWEKVLQEPNPPPRNLSITPLSSFP